jgi:hypothetical protein
MDGWMDGWMGWWMGEWVVELMDERHILECNNLQSIYVLFNDALSPRVERQRREADYSPSSSAEFENSGTMPPLPQVFTAWCLINLAQGQLYL